MINNSHRNPSFAAELFKLLDKGGIHEHINVDLLLHIDIKYFIFVFIFPSGKGPYDSARLWNFNLIYPVAKEKNGSCLIMDNITVKIKIYYLKNISIFYLILSILIMDYYNSVFIIYIYIYRFILHFIIYSNKRK